MTKYEVFAEHQKTNKNQVRQTGNYYYGARYYNPKWSTWLSVDPLVEKTMEAYGYVHQNPIKLIDPTGMSAESCGCPDPPCDKQTRAPRPDVDSMTYSGYNRNSKVINPAPKVNNEKPEKSPSSQTATVVPVLAVGSLESSTVAISATTLSVTAVLATTLTLQGDDSRQEPYLYRHMISEPGSSFSSPKPMLGQGANKLGLRSIDVSYRQFNEVISANSTDGLSVTLGFGNHRKDWVDPTSIRNKSNKTSLFRLNVYSLPALGLKATPIEGTYWRITPAFNMTIAEFNERIQSTQTLWQKAKTQ